MADTAKGEHYLMGHLEFCYTVLEAKCVHDLEAALVFVIDVVTVRSKLSAIVVATVISAGTVCAARSMVRNKVVDTGMNAGSKFESVALCSRKATFLPLENCYYGCVRMRPSWRGCGFTLARRPIHGADDTQRNLV